MFEILFLSTFFIALIDLLELIILFEIFVQVFDFAIPLEIKNDYFTDRYKKVENIQKRERMLFWH